MFQVSCGAEFCLKKPVDSSEIIEDRAINLKVKSAFSLRAPLGSEIMDPGHRMCQGSGFWKRVVLDADR